MAGLILPARTTGGSRALAFAPHAVMLGAMVVGMVGAHSAVRMLAASAALIVTSFACARRARTDPMWREHLADLWGMALVFVAVAPGHVAGHAHGALPRGVVGVCLIGLGWALVRVVLARHRWRRALPTALLFVAGALPMAMLCT